MVNQSSKKPAPTAKRVRFAFHAPEAHTVSLGGNFNNWDINSLPMKKDAKGTWRATVNLEPGRYEYRFYVDGAWRDDPNIQEKVDNPFGGQNCVRTVR